MENRKIKKFFTKPKKKMRIAGLMSGTSADGVDVAIIDFDGKKAHLLAFDTIRYPPSLRKNIFRLFDPATSRADNICRLNFAIGEFFALALIKVAASKAIPLNTIDLIGSHGQTIYHIPALSTLQIGEPCIIAQRTGITTVADFRPRDIASGGQGAPLVPYADFILFQDQRITRVIQNIGGIANLTYLPAGGGIDDVLAFDTGPGNMIIDHLTSIITNGRRLYDAAGNLASKGKINEKLLNEMMRHPFLKLKPPKSTGRETFGHFYTDKLFKSASKKQIDPLDIITTATAFTAKTIALAYKKYLPDKIDQIILCGGGAKNKTLVKLLELELPETKIFFITDFGIEGNAKEAISFAILAYATVHNMPNNVPSATGAKHPAVLGKIIPGNN